MKSKITTAAVLICLIAQAALAYNPPFDPNSPGGYRHEGGITFTLDYFYNPSDGYYWGDANAPAFEIWELGARIKDGKLEFSMWTDLPEAGAEAPDSYSGGQNVNQSPGDLWITVGSQNPFSTDPNVRRHAIALTGHANVVPQKYAGVWPAVTKGRLYKDAVAALGSYEEYQEFMESNDWWYYPNDQDGQNDQNSYMSLIMGFGEEVTGSSSATWTQEDYWDDDAGDWAVAWRITGDVALDEIGLADPATWMNFSLFVSSECGNDGAVHTPIPEPGVLTLLAAGLGLVRRKRRR